MHEDERIIRIGKDDLISWFPRKATST